MNPKLKFYFSALLRRGFLYRRLIQQLEQTQFLDLYQIEEYQNQKLKKLINHCYKNVPFYKEQFRKLRLKPKDIKTKEDLIKLPYIDKSVVKRNFNNFLSRKRIPLLCTMAQTSGSTGSPSIFARDYYSINFENAVLWRQWKAAGDITLPRITLRGDIIVPVIQKEPPFWIFNNAQNELLMSSYHLSEENAKHYIQKILNFKPKILYAYPSTANFLAHLFKENSVDYSFQSVFTSSESLYESQKIFIESTFSSQVFDWYGQAERVVGIGHCENGKYHIQEDYSIVELLPNEHGLEPVGTSLFNYTMPLINYRTGDLIDICNEQCDCGRNFRVVNSIIGRDVDYILTPEGHQIYIVNHIPRGVDNLIECQFFQKKKSEIIVRAVVTELFSKKDELLLIKNTLEHTSPSMDIRVEPVSEIERGPNGKFKTIINQII